MLKKIAIFSLILAAFSLYAEGEYEGKLQETVVTATGFSDNIENQIKNITVITSEDIQEKGYNNVEEILRRAPGVNFVNNKFGNIVDIRGQGPEKAAGRVKVLVDGVPMNILDLSHGLVPINTVAVENIEKIEIINGGGSVLYGNGTAGGVVNIITKKDGKEGASGKAYFQNSSYKTNKLGFSTGLNLNNKLILDLGYENINGRGYRENDKKSSEFLKGGLIYNITDNQSLKFKATRYNEEYRESSGITATQLAHNRKQRGETLTFGDVVRKEYSLEYNVKPTENFELSVLGYKQKMRREYDQKDSKIDTDGLFQDRKTGVRLKGNYNYGLGNLIFGYEYTDNDMLRKALDNSLREMGGRLVRVNTDTNVNLSKNTHSFYLLERHTFFDKLEGTLGYRYENSKYKIDRNSKVSMMGMTMNDSMVTNKKGHNNAYEVGLNYKYSDTGNVYAKYEKGYRSPSPTEMVDKSPLTGYSLNNIKPETYDTYEIGLKDMIGNSFVSLTGFYTKTKDEIFIHWGAGGHSGYRRDWTYRNVQETERKGFEVFAEQYLGKFRINESVSYVNAKVTKGNEKGKKIPYVPSTKATLGGVYDITDNVAVRADLNYYSSAEDQSGYKIKSYATADLSSSYKHSSGLKIEAGIKNVFNKKYNVYQDAKSDVYKPADERTYFIGASYEF